MVRLVIFGDSITRGINDSEKQGWVREYFWKKTLDISVYNYGISGDNSEDLVFLDEIKDSSHPDSNRQKRVFQKIKREFNNGKNCN